MALLDALGRPLRNLRLSVTDRCNLRCQYCMPEADYVWLPREDVLHFEEISTIADVFLSLGVERLRLTGGEPLLRRDLPSLVRMLSAKPGLDDLAMTTNGILLAEQVHALKAAGLRRVTVSLDTLRPDRFIALTRYDELARVKEGIEAARSAFAARPTDNEAAASRRGGDPQAEAEAESLRSRPRNSEAAVRGCGTPQVEAEGESLRSSPRDSEAAATRAGGGPQAEAEAESLRSRPRESEAAAPRGGGAPRVLKIDTVVIKGVNDDELGDLIEYSKSVNAELRFIEYMDVGGATQWSVERVVSRAEMLQALGRRYGRIEPLLDDDSSAPADRFVLPDGTIFGVISSTTEPFCHSCDRSRLTADGMWYFCLYATQGVDLRGPLRSGATPEALKALIAERWSGRADRGAEDRLAVRQRHAFVPLKALRRDPHLEMHTRGG